MREGRERGDGKVNEEGFRTCNEELRSTIKQGPYISTPITERYDQENAKTYLLVSGPELAIATIPLLLNYDPSLLTVSGSCPFVWRQSTGSVP